MTAYCSLMADSEGPQSAAIAWGDLWLPARILLKYGAVVNSSVPKSAPLQTTAWSKGISLFKWVNMFLCDTIRHLGNAVSPRDVEKPNCSLSHNDTEYNVLAYRNILIHYKYKISRLLYFIVWASGVP